MTKNKCKEINEKCPDKSTKCNENVIPNDENNKNVIITNFKQDGEFYSEIDTNLKKPFKSTEKTQIECIKKIDQLSVEHATKLSNFNDKIKKIQDFSLEEIINFMNNNESGDADLYKILNNGKYLRDNKTLKWYFKNGHYWAEDEDSLHQKDGFDRVILAYLNGITELLEKYDRVNVNINENDSELQEKLQGLIKRIMSINARLYYLQSSVRQLSVLKFVTIGNNSLGISNDKWNKKLNLLPCKNLLYDLDLHKRVDPKPDDYINYCIPTEYKPEAKCPVFEKMLFESFNKKQEKVNYLQTLYGYGLRGNCEENIISVHLGFNGRNCKSITNKILLACLGPEKIKNFNSSFIKLNKGNSNSEGATPITSSLQDANFAIINEVNAKDKLDPEKLKQMSGGDSIPTRDMYGGARQFENTSLLMINTNARLSIPNDNALWERIKILLYELSFVDNPDQNKRPWERKRDKTLKKRIIDNELSGVLNWILDGNATYYDVGMIYPDCVIEDTLTIRIQEDSVYQFIQERCSIENSNAYTPFINVYNNYLNFCDETKIKNPLAKNSFSTDLNGKGYISGRKNNQAIICGIIIKCR